MDKDVNETIDHIEHSIETIIHDAAQTANDLASNLTHDVEEIISKASSAMEQVEKTFYQDASNLLTQINQIVQKGQCMEAAFAKQIQDGIYKLLKSLDPSYRLSSCWHSLGYKASMTLEDLTDIQLYNYQKECTLLNKITPNTPIEGPGGILQTYAQGQLYAAEYYCIGETANAPAFQDVLSREWLWWGVQYNAWRNIAEMITKNSSHHTVEDDQGTAVQQLLNNDPCGTPVECYAQAIEALNEAKQKILSLQTELSNLNQTVIANQLELKDNMSAVAQAISINTNASATNTYAITTLKANVSAIGQAVSTNTNAIAENKNTITKLKPYPCNCTNISNSLVCPATALAQAFSAAGSNTIKCCQLCMGSAEEAAYAWQNPVVDREPFDL